MRRVGPAGRRRRRAAGGASLPFAAIDSFRFPIIGTRARVSVSVVGHAMNGGRRNAIREQRRLDGSHGK